MIKIGESNEDLRNFGKSKMSLPVQLNLSSPAVRYETWGFPVGKLGSTRLPVMVYKDDPGKGSYIVPLHYLYFYHTAPIGVALFFCVGTAGTVPSSQHVTRPC